MQGFVFVGVTGVDELVTAVVDQLAERLEKQYVSVDEYAKMLGISRRTVSRAIADGRLEVERSGWRISIDRNARITK